MNVPNAADQPKSLPDCGTGRRSRFGDAIRSGSVVWSQPAHDILVNITGSFCIGAFAASTGSTTIRLLLGTGVLGGFTTFSAWQLEAVLSVRLRGFTQAPLWILFGSLGAGFASCWARLSGRRSTAIWLSFLR